MTDDTCLTPQQLDGYLDAPAEHSAAAHVGQCPRCRALVSEYRAFLSQEAPLPTDADVPDAQLRLSAVLQEEIFGARKAPAAISREPGFWEKLVAMWREPIPAPAFVLVAAIVVLGGAVTWQMRGGLDGEPPRLRGDGSPGDNRGQSALALSEVQLTDAGLWQLEWTPAPEADAYRVIFYSPRLEEIARREIPGGTRLFFDPRELNGDAAEGVLWVVVALGGGDELRRSAVGVVARDGVPR